MSACVVLHCLVIKSQIISLRGTEPVGTYTTIYLSETDIEATFSLVFLNSNSVCHCFKSGKHISTLHVSFVLCSMQTALWCSMAVVTFLNGVSYFFKPPFLSKQCRPVAPPIRMSPFSLQLAEKHRLSSRSYSELNVSEVGIFIKSVFICEG